MNVAEGRSSFTPMGISGENSASRIRELIMSDLDAVLRFSDRQIGQDYFSPQKLAEIIEASTMKNVSVSFVLEDEEGIQGIRLTYPPGQWLKRHVSQPAHPELWRVPLAQVGYFQSLFIAPKYQGQGFGQRLSMASVENLRKLNTKAVVCHSWDESPNNSSRKYLNSLGFEPVCQIPNYWKQIDYECTRCGKPCVCTATEMILYFEGVGK